MSTDRISEVEVLGTLLVEDTDLVLKTAEGKDGKSDSLLGRDSPDRGIV
jgi:hypothetical protein